MGRGTRKTPKRKKSKSPRRSISGGSSSPRRSPGAGGRANIVLKKQIGSNSRGAEENGTWKYREGKNRNLENHHIPTSGSAGKTFEQELNTPREHNSQTCESEYSNSEGDTYAGNESGEEFWSLNQVVTNGLQAVRSFVGSMREARQYLPSPEGSEDVELLEDGAYVETERFSPMTHGSERSDREDSYITPESGRTHEKEHSAQGQVVLQEESTGLRMAKDSKDSDGSKKKAKGKGKAGDGGSDATKTPDADGGTVAGPSGSTSSDISVPPSVHRPVRPGIGRDARMRGDRSFRPGSSASGPGGGIITGTKNLKATAADTDRKSGMPASESSKSGVGAPGIPVRDTDKITKPAGGTIKSSDPKPKALDDTKKVATGGSRPTAPGGGLLFDDSGPVVRPVIDYSKLSVGKSKLRRANSPGRAVLTPGSPDAHGVSLLLPAGPALPPQKGSFIIGSMPQRLSSAQIAHPPGLDPVPAAPPRPATPAIYLTPPRNPLIVELRNPRKSTHLVPPKKKDGWQLKAKRPPKDTKPPKPSRASPNVIGGPPMIPPAIGGGSGFPGGSVPPGGPPLVLPRPSRGGNGVGNGGGPPGPPGGDGLVPIFENPGCPQSGAMLVGVIVSLIFIAAYMLGGRRKEEKLQAARQSRLSRLLGGLPTTFTGTSDAVRTKMESIKHMFTTVHDMVPMSERIGSRPPVTISTQTKKTSQEVVVDHRAEALKQLGLPTSANWEDISLHLTNQKKPKKLSEGTCGTDMSLGMTSMPVSTDTKTITTRVVTATKYRDPHEGEGVGRTMSRVKPKHWSRKDWQMYTRIPAEIFWCPAIDVKECLPSEKNNDVAISNVLAEVERTLEYFRDTVKKQKQFIDIKNGRLTTQAPEYRPQLPPITSTSSLPNSIKTLPTDISASYWLWLWLQFYQYLIEPLKRSMPILQVSPLFKGAGWTYLYKVGGGSIHDWLSRLLVDIRISYRIPPEFGGLDALMLYLEKAAQFHLSFWFPPLSYYLEPQFFTANMVMQIYTIICAIVRYQISTFLLLNLLRPLFWVLSMMLHLILNRCYTSYQRHFKDHHRLAEHGGGNYTRACHALLNFAKTVFAYFDLILIQNAKAMVWGRLLGWLAQLIWRIFLAACWWWISSPLILIDLIAILTCKDRQGELSIWNGMKRVWKDFFKPPLLAVVWTVFIVKASPVFTLYCLSRLVPFIWWVTGFETASGYQQRKPRAPVTPHRPPDASLSSPGGTRHLVPFTIDRMLLQSERKVERALTTKFKHEERLRQLRFLAAETKSNLLKLEAQFDDPATRPDEKPVIQAEIARGKSNLDPLKMAMALELKRINITKQALQDSLTAYDEGQAKFSRAVCNTSRYRRDSFRGESEFQGLTPSESRALIERSMKDMGLEIHRPTPLTQIPETVHYEKNPQLQIGGVSNSLAGDISTNVGTPPATTNTRPKSSMTSSEPATGNELPGSSIEPARSTSTPSVASLSTKNPETGLRRVSHEREPSTDSLVGTPVRQTPPNLDTERDTPVVDESDAPQTAFLHEVVLEPLPGLEQKRVSASMERLIPKGRSRPEHHCDKILNEPYSRDNNEAQVIREDRNNEKKSRRVEDNAKKHEGGNELTSVGRVNIKDNVRGEETRGENTMREVGLDTPVAHRDRVVETASEATSDVPVINFETNTPIYSGERNPSLTSESLTSGNIPPASGSETVRPTPSNSTPTTRHPKTQNSGAHPPGEIYSQFPRATATPNTPEIAQQLSPTTQSAASGRMGRVETTEAPYPSTATPNFGMSMSPVRPSPRRSRSLMDLLSLSLFGQVERRQSGSPTSAYPSSNTQRPPVQLHSTEVSSAPQTPSYSRGSPVTMSPPAHRISQTTPLAIPHRAYRSEAPSPTTPPSRSLQKDQSRPLERSTKSTESPGIISTRIRPPTNEDLLPSEEDTPMRRNVFRRELVEQYYRQETERLEREDAEARAASESRRRSTDSSFPQTRLEEDPFQSNMLLEQFNEMRRDRIRASQAQQNPSHQHDIEPGGNNLRPSEGSSDTSGP